MPCCRSTAPNCWPTPATPDPQPVGPEYAKAGGERRGRMDILWIVIIVLIVLALLGFLGRGRFF